MSNAVAFFDVDGTLVRLRTMFDFQEFYWNATLTARAARVKMLAFRARFGLYDRCRVPRERINRLYYRTYRGRSPEWVKEVAREWFARLLQHEASWKVDAAWRKLLNHKASGHRVVLVSGSLDQILEPLARHLQADVILATRLVVRGGLYTGELAGEPMIGAGKLASLQKFLASERVAANECFAYGDHISDLPMLNAVGYPTIVGGDARLKTHALTHSWPALEA